jgi:uncharacterized sporulation protein YeaH/YhbH (DUF444 family)
LYYNWSKSFLEAGKKRLMGDITREATSDEVGNLKRENERLKILLAELMLENSSKKKACLAQNKEKGYAIQSRGKDGNYPFVRKLRAGYKAYSY